MAVLMYFFFVQNKIRFYEFVWRTCYFIMICLWFIANLWDFLRFLVNYYLLWVYNKLPINSIYCSNFINKLRSFFLKLSQISFSSYFPPRLPYLPPKDFFTKLIKCITKLLQKFFEKQLHKIKFMYYLHCPLLFAFPLLSSFFFTHFLYRFSSLNCRRTKPLVAL